MQNKKLLFGLLAVVLMGVTAFGGFLFTNFSASIPKVEASKDSPEAKSLTVTAPTFEVSFDRSQYFLVSPFQRLVKIWAEVKNTGRQADTLEFITQETLPAGWGIRAEGDITLEPGEVKKFKVVIVGYSGGEKNIKLDFTIESEKNTGSTASASIGITYADLENFSSDARIINVYNSNTKKPIPEAAVYYRIGSQSEGARQTGDGKFEIQIYSYQSLVEFAQQYGIAWQGYALEVYASGYQSYYEEAVNFDGPEKNIYLNPLEESVNYEPAWTEELEYPGVWRLVASENGNYIAAAMGKHWDEGDIKGPATVPFFSADGGLLWSYPVESSVWGIDINQDGSLIAAGTIDGTLRVFNRSGDQVWSHYFDDSHLREVRFSNTGAYIGVEGNPIKIFNTSDGTVAAEIVTPVDPVWRGITFFGQDDKQVLYGGDNDLLLLDIEKQDVVWHQYISGLPYDIMVTEDLYRIVVADKGDSLSSFDAQGNLLWRHSDIDVLTDADMSEDGSRIVALSHDGTVRMYDGDGKLLWRRAVGSGGHNGIDMSADGNYIAVGGGSTESPYKVFVLDSDGNLLWNHSQPGPVTPGKHPYTISTMSVLISDDGSSVVAGYGTGNPGVQLFKGKISSGSKGKKEAQAEGIVNKYMIAGVAGVGVVILGVAVFFVIRFVRRRRIHKDGPQS